MTLQKLLERAGLTTNFQPSNILTDEERIAALNAAISREKNAYIYRMAMRGANEHQIALGLNSKNWNEMINEDEVLALAAIAKERELDNMRSEERRRKSLKAIFDRVKNECTADYFHSQVKEFFEKKHGKFIYDHTNKRFIDAVCYFMSMDNRFETELGFSFKKGLAILGSSGLGKTKVMQAVSINPLCRVYVHSILDIVDHVKKHGECNLNFDLVYMIDDVGTEDIVNFYGTKVNWFKDFIEQYYLQKSTYNKLIITSNLGGEEIEQKYGYRVRSRIREMFNVIQVQGQDMRN